MSGELGTYIIVIMLAILTFLSVTLVQVRHDTENQVKTLEEIYKLLSERNNSGK